MYFSKHSKIILFPNHISLVLLFILVIGQALSTHGKEYITLTNGEWPPYTSQHLPNLGAFSHIVTAAFSLEDIEVDYEFYPWKRAYVLAKNGKFEGSLTWAPTNERKKDFFFTEPVTFNQKVFFHLQSLNFKWHTLNDLKGFKIGATRHYTYGKAFDQAAIQKYLDVEYINLDIQNVKKLLSKRIQLFPMELEVGYHLIHSELPHKAHLITHNQNPIIKTPVSVIISKRIPPKRAKRLVNAFNRGLTKLKESGEYSKIMNTHLKHSKPH